ncbi:MAG: hypothetical protein H7Y38_00860 [Armatimonadetes bacterium]|nr:hypothetical protein [Armatimonadota bacterium]
MTDTPELRRRGRKSADAAERRARVESALADLTASRTPFSMGDVAERAGISRATLYRDAGLRDLVGAQGDKPANPVVTFRDYQKEREKSGNLQAERKTLRKELRDAAEIKAGLEREIEKLETRVANYVAHFAKVAAQDTESVRKEAFAEGFSQGVRTAMGQRGGATRPGSPGAGANRGGIGAASSLGSVAAGLSKSELQTARRNLARVLHPDLFAGDDPATATLATELLKQINALAASGADAEKRGGGL